MSDDEEEESSIVSTVQLKTVQLSHGESKQTRTPSSECTTMREATRIEAADFASSLSSSSSAVNNNVNNENNKMRPRKRIRRTGRPLRTRTRSSTAATVATAVSVVFFLLGFVGRDTFATFDNFFVGAEDASASFILVHSSASTDAGGAAAADDPHYNHWTATTTSSSTNRFISEKKRSLQTERPPELDVTPAPAGPPTVRPSQRPTAKPTDQPTVKPTLRPTAKPTDRPTLRPTREPTHRPTRGPTNRPTREPTDPPSRQPTRPPTTRPTFQPTARPTFQPTNQPTFQPTSRPSLEPTTAVPTPVTAFPTARRTQLAGPTRSPSFFFGFLTRRPTARPTLKPTASPTVPRTPRPTVRPTVQPSPGPTVKPTVAPTRRPTKQPTKPPTARPTKPPTLPPTRFPTIPMQPTREPTTRQPTSLPTVRQTVEPTRVKSSKKSNRPTRIPTVAPTEAPTERVVVLERVALPIDFTADVVLPESVAPNEVNMFAARVAGIWERYLGAIFQEQAGLDEFLSWISIDLTVVPGAIVADETLQLRRRWLQDNGGGGNATDPVSVRLTTSGEALFQIDPNEVNKKKFLKRMQQLLDDALTLEQLQTALANGGNAATVSAVASGEVDTQGSNKPSLVDTIIGFTIVAIAAASLVFYGVVLNRKRKKKLKKRQMTAVSKQRTSMPLSTPPRPMPVTTKADTSSDGSSASYKGVGSPEEEDAASDPFGRELEQAASLDKAAWEDFQRQKRAMEDEGDAYSASPGRSVYETVGIAGPMYATNSGQEQGVEIDVGGIPRTGSFPYGDEVDPEIPSNPPPVQRQAVALTAENAVPWTATGISLNVTGTAKKKRNNRNGGTKNEEEGWEPYGDSPGRNGLAPSYGTTPDRAAVSIRSPGYGPSPDGEVTKALTYRTSPNREDARPPNSGNSLDRETIGQSWTPALKEEQPSQYSFLYPLIKQDHSPVVNDRASTTVSSTDTSSAAIRSSPTSWSTFMGLGPRASPPPADDSENENPDDSAMTAEMVKEVEELAQFVQQYEKKKETRKQKEVERRMRLDTESELRSIPVGQQGAVGEIRKKQDAPDASPLRPDRQARNRPRDPLYAPAPSERLPAKSENKDRDARPPARLPENPQPNSVKKNGGLRVSSLGANESSQRNSGRKVREMRPLARFSAKPQPNSVKKDGGARVSSLADEPSQRNSGRIDSREVRATEKASAKKPVKLPASDFFLPNTEDPDMMLSSSQPLYLPVVPGSFETSSGSDSGSEAEDDTSQRLGISRFSVQKPPAPLLTFKADPVEQSLVPPVARPRQEKSAQSAQEKSPAILRQPSEPPLAENEADLTDEDDLPLRTAQGLPNGRQEEKREARQGVGAMQGLPNGRLEEKKEASQRVRADDRTPKPKGGGRKGALRSLRGNTAMLDGAASEEATSEVNEPYDEVHELVPPSQISRGRSPLNTTPKRSKNKSFNNIMNMFESKPKTPIVPPNETVRNRS